MWEFEHSVEAPVSRQRVWALWTDISGWPSWNPGVSDAELDGPVIDGATRLVHAEGGPTPPLQVLPIEPERHFVPEASERCVRLRFDDERTEMADGELRITQRARMTGLATPLLRHTAGARLERSI